MERRKHTARMVMLAKRRLGMTGSKNRAVFEKLAEHFGDWDGTKAHGIDLVYRYVAIHKGTPLPKSKREAKATWDQSPRSPKSDEFLRTYQWRQLRMRVLLKRGARCECCGATPEHGVKMNVDHIKPRLKYPALALEESNLQVLCDECNHGKGNWDETDWRKVADPMAPRLVTRA